MPTGYQKEQYSYQFNIDGVEIEQTVTQSFNPFSGMDIDTGSFQNTNQSLNDSNQDGRIPLGCFIFDEDNQYTNDFPDVFRDNKFKQIKRRNLIKNGSGKGVQSKWTRQQFLDANGYYNFDHHVTPYIPLGNWSYCTFDALLDENKVRNDELYVDNNLSQNGFEDYDIGRTHLLSFEQTDFTAADLKADDPNRQPDNNGTIGSSGWFPYCFDYAGTLARPQVHLDMIKRGFRYYSETFLNRYQTRLGIGRMYESQSRYSTYTNSQANPAYPNVNDCDEFFYRLNYDSYDLSKFRYEKNDEGVFTEIMTDNPGIIPTSAKPTGWSSNAPGRVLLPNIAKWIITDEANSYGKCLEFLATNINNQANLLTTTLNYTSTNFDWNDPEKNYINPSGITNNQHRLLNQCIEIKDNKQLNKNATMTLRFKMWTDSRFYNDGDPFPAVETSLHDSDSNLQEPMRTHDRINYSKQYGYSHTHGYWPQGEFHSTRYNDDLNSPNTVDKKYSGFGSMGRFQNTQLDTWETFEYTFSLGRWYHYGTSGNARNLYFMIQAAGTFLGRVLIDDMELIESYDFVPDVSVVKKISAGEYGTANLTKYYDKELQPEKYKDSQVPLTAQFYFYPTYKTDKTFDVSRTPMYRDFKNGLFYLYDVDWGDGSPREFVSEPLPIDENKAPCHLYTKSGIFEVTGTMIRMKADNGGINPIGIAHSKKFKVRINVNDGVGEDFEYFGSDGFSFLPYRNTLPIIGGYSKESSYYKTIKRNLGFISDDTKIKIPFRYDGDKLKTELALVKMENQSNNDLELLPSYMIPRYAKGPGFGDYRLQPSIEGQSGFREENEITWNYGDLLINTDNIPSGLISIFRYSDAAFVEFNEDAGVWDTANSQWDTLQNGKQYAFVIKVGDPPVGWSLLNDLSPPVPEILIHNGISPIKEELGKGIGDCDLTNIKYYTEPKSIWETLGFENQDTGSIGNPTNPRYWKNIIPTDYSIFNRQGLGGEIIDTYSEQDWLGQNEYGNTYYYPVLPKYDQSGRFIEDDFPNDKIPFPLEAPITDENDSDKSLLIHIMNESMDTNIIKDISGNDNLGFVIMDYKPNFNTATLSPEKVKKIKIIKTSTNNGVF